MTPASRQQRIEEKLDALVAAYARQEALLEGMGEDVRQNKEDLREHMRRTANVEERVSPLERHVAMWSGVGKAVAILGTVATVCACLLKALEWFSRA